MRELPPSASEPARLADRALEIRAAFDASFARPSAPPAEEQVDLLAVRVGGAAWAIRLGEIGGVVAARRVVAVPARAAGLLGLAGVRGDVAPVYDLAHFLGVARDAAPTTRAYWVVERGHEPIVLALETVDAQVRVPRSAIRTPARADGAPPPSMEVAMTAHGALPLIDLSRVFTAIRTGTDAVERSDGP